MLSLSPRFDLFKFNFPKEFICEELRQKYDAIIARNPGVITNSVDYLNESIQSINFPGISAEVIRQEQHSHNTIKPSNNGLGRLNVEPKTDISYTSMQNPLDMIEKSFTVQFRMNQGLYNYFLLYETFFHNVCKPKNEQWFPELYIDLMNETGTVTSRIKLQNVVFQSIDSLDFSFNTLEREMKTFSCAFVFSNIDFDFVDIEKENIF